MYDLAKKARAGMKSKAERLAGEKDRKTDSSDWSPAPELNADVKTGMRPVSRRAYKSGGKVDGCAPKGRADRMPRKAGGKVEEKSEQPLVDRYVNRDLKKANEYRDGKKHVGALRHGGRARKANGGSMTMEEMIAKNPAPAKKPLGLDKIPVPTPRPANLTPAANNKIKPDQKKYLTGDDITGPPKQVRKDGGRAKKADGGPMMQDPRLGIVKPKAMEFGQNVVTPGLKKGGRVGKAAGGSSSDDGYATYDLFRGWQNIEKATPDQIANMKPADAAAARAAQKKSATIAPKVAPVRKEPMRSEPSTRGRGTTTPPSTPVKSSYTPPRVMGGGQGVTNRAEPSATTGTPPREQRYYEDSAPVNYGASLGNKRGGRIKKQIGGGLSQAAGALGRGLASAAPGFAMRPQMPQQMPMGTNPAMIGRRPMQQAMPSMPQTTSAILPQIDTTGSAPLSQSDALAQLGTPQMTAYATGGRVARAYGGETKKKSKSKSGKTHINIVIATGQGKDQAAAPAAPMGGMPPAPPPPPPMPPAAGPMAGPMGAPPMPPPAAGGGMPPLPPELMGGAPMARKAGGRVTKVAKSYKDMTAGAGSGEGRLQKTDIAKRAPHKRGGKVYRSYKDMDAGAGSGEGRLEKTEIQKRKK